MTLSDRSMCMTLHQSTKSSLSSLFLIRLLWSSGQGMKRSIHILHILQSQKPDPIEKTYHTIRSRCACVWNFSGWNSHPFLHNSIFYFKIRAVFLFLSFSFSFFPCFWARIFFFCFSFALPILFLQHEESYQRDGVFLCGWEAYFCVTSSVEASMSIYGVYVILILKA